MFLLFHPDDTFFKLGVAILICVAIILIFSIGASRLSKPPKNPVMFFLLFQKGGPLSAVPMVLAGGAAINALVGILFFKEPATLIRSSGILLSLVGLFLLRYTPN